MRLVDINTAVLFIYYYYTVIYATPLYRAVIN
uniref:Uncharacterized protein n=1 Tax=Arundo donax TaxID=35708 RepID=A0A0A9EDB0_ARUDO